MAYVTRADFLSYLDEMSGGIPAADTAPAQAVIDSFLAQAVAEVERITGRTFEAAEATRSFGEESITDGTLWLETDAVSVSAIVNGDGAALSSGDWRLWPLNETPKRRITLKNGKTWAFSTDGLVEVTGSWGFSATPPADVKRAVMRLAYFYWQKRGATGETSFMGDDLVQAAAKYPADVMAVLDAYRWRGVA